MVELATTLKHKIEAGKKIIGPLVGPRNEPAPTAQALKDFGCDFIMVDLEHNLVNKETVFEYIRAAADLNMPILVRPEENTSFFRSYLDSGANGLMLPHVDTVEQAVFAVNQSYFAPIGNRGCGMGPYLVEPKSRRDKPFLSLMQYVNTNTVLFPQTESLKNISNLRNILKLEGITGTVVGTFDLAIDIGGIDPHAVMQEMIETPMIEDKLREILSICRQAGKVAGLGGFAPEGCAKWARAGYQMFILGYVVEGNVSSQKSVIGQARSLVE